VEYTGNALCYEALQSAKLSLLSSLRSDFMSWKRSLSLIDQ